MENNLTWLLVADASKARIFSMHKAKLLQKNANGQSLKLINEFTHKESRMKDAELISDKLGEFNKNSYGVEKPKVHEAEYFATQLINELGLGHQERHFRDLILIAPPTFMGMLNKHLPNAIQKLVIQTIEKDYTQDSQHDLTKKLITHL